MCSTEINFVEAKWLFFNNAFTDVLLSRPILVRTVLVFSFSILRRKENCISLIVFREILCSLVRYKCLVCYAKTEFCFRYWRDFVKCIGLFCIWNISVRESDRALHIICIIRMAYLWSVFNTIQLIESQFAHLGNVCLRLNKRILYRNVPRS